MSNLLAHGIVKDLAGTSCSIHITGDNPCGVSFMIMKPSEAVGTDLPHFFCTHDIAQDFEIAYFGPEPYQGLVDCDSYVVRNMMDLQDALSEIADREKPKICLLDFDHLGMDRSMAMCRIVDFIEDSDQWEEQAVIDITRNVWRAASWNQTAGRMLRPGPTAQVHSRQLVDNDSSIN